MEEASSVRYVHVRIFDSTALNQQRSRLGFSPLGRVRAAWWMWHLSSILRAPIYPGPPWLVCM